MNRMDKLKIGLALNGIATLVDDETFARIKSRLDEIEEIVLNEPTDNEEPSSVTGGCLTCKYGNDHNDADEYPCTACVFSKWTAKDEGGKDDESTEEVN